MLDFFSYEFVQFHPKIFDLYPMEFYHFDL